MKVTICVPAHGDTKARFTAALAGMLSWTYQQHIIYNGVPSRPSIGYRTQIGSRVDTARNILAAEALEDGPDYVLWLDADQTFPPDALLRLIAHDKALVGCNYPKRETNRSSAASWTDGEGYKAIEPRESGIEAVDALGFGVLLMKIEVLRAVPRPWFRLAGPGEDYGFCEEARAHGIQPYVDHGIKVGHIAETVLTFAP